MGEERGCIGSNINRIRPQDTHTQCLNCRNLESVQPVLCPPSSEALHYTKRDLNMIIELKATAASSTTKSVFCKLSDFVYIFDVHVTVHRAKFSYNKTN